MGAGREDWTLLASAELIGHGTTHQDGGADEFSLEALSGSPAVVTSHVALQPDSVTKPHDIREVDETSISTNKNKCVSNLLAKNWETAYSHVSDTPTGATKPHGIGEVDVTSTDATKNKCVSNALAKVWEDHKDNTALHLQAGLITIWTGTLANIPSGWALCDGTGTYPNLLDKFVVGVPNGTTDPGGTGGAATHTHDVGSYAGPSHTHTLENHSTTGTVGWAAERGAADNVSADALTGTEFNARSAQAGGTGAITGTSAAGSSLPPYYVVAFIIKT